MEVRGKRALVLGGAGLVGMGVIRELLRHEVRDIVLCALTEREVETAMAEIRSEFPTAKLLPYWGNVFVPLELKDASRTELLGNEKFRRLLVHDIVSPLHREVIERSTLYYLFKEYRPEIVMDSINSATAFSYQDVFTTSLDLFDRAGDQAQIPSADVEKLLATQYTPQLIRHVQILFEAMTVGKTHAYIKVGTSGTGGMGLNIPYTHSEDKPSRMLLAKSAVAGAHSLLLFLMARTPGAPIVKEIKPAAAIAWKKIEHGPVMVKGKPVKMEDVSLQDAAKVEDLSDLLKPPPVRYLQDRSGKERYLEAPYIDSGENGQFARGEFEALTDSDQMEFVTPEEVARFVVWEIEGRNTGHDVINAMDNATVGPTYRAGFLRKFAIDQLRDLESLQGVDSVAFENLGPPRLSKILFEAYLLRKTVQTFEKLRDSEPGELGRHIVKLLESDRELRSRMLSIGLPVLLPDGRLLRGQHMKIPAKEDFLELVKLKKVTPELIEEFAHDGWVDLREKNMKRWRNRAEMVLAECEAFSKTTSSSVVRNARFWKEYDQDGSIPPGKMAGWIFTYEEEGARMKS